MTVRLTFILAAALLLAGCGAFRSQEAGEDRPLFGSGKQPPSGAGVNLHAGIPAPSIPPDLTAQARGLGVGQAADGRLYNYTVEVKAQKEELAATFEKISRLSQMQAEAATMTTLEQRLSVSLEEGLDILHSYGYYEGKVDGRIEPAGDGRLKAVVVFTHGPRYKIGSSKIILTNPLDKRNEAKAPPKTLADVGLETGAPAMARDVLAAVARVEDSFRNLGYPRARGEGTRFVIDRSQKTLDAEVQGDPRHFASLGDVIRPADAPVDQH